MFEVGVSCGGGGMLLCYTNSLPGRCAHPPYPLKYFIKTATPDSSLHRYSFANYT